METEEFGSLNPCEMMIGEVEGWGD